jgi:hypothetical protein
LRDKRFYSSAPLSEPEAYKQNEDERGQKEPRDYDDLDSQPANGRDVAVDVWVAIKEAVAIAKDIGKTNQVYNEEERCGDPESWKS